MRSAITDHHDDTDLGYEGAESPFLCNFCDDIKIAAGNDMDIQRELDVCRRCTTIDRSLRFSDFLLVH